MKNKNRLFSSILLFLCIPFMFNAPANAASFSDTHPGEKAYTAIEEMKEKEMIAGFPDGTFRQYKPVTRAQSAIFVARMLHISPDASLTTTFKDISPGQAAYPYIAELTNKGVFSASDRFHPDRSLTRAEMAIILVRAFNLQGTIDAPFSDVHDGMKAAPYIHALAATRITTGTGNNRYDPYGTVTRGQMAIFMSNIDKYRYTNANPETQPEPTPGDPAEISYEIDPNFAPNSIEQQIFLLVNQERMEAGVNPLKLANDLSFVARVKSKDMRDQNYFDHQSPVYGSPFNMMNDFGLDYMAAGENIAGGQDSAVAVMNAWMNSTGHRNNILNPDFAEIGIGYVDGGSYGSYFTQMFMTR
ncbi:S-layer homology domain-containing protein [Domibacillus epiphyticus]|uniref:SLH domain-containing protein n=1 Tax=Domibacillus epiphyticus TaxID=1714355 RepID=A0A1V2A6U4_9BACI|nr:S-layer homology domain-containing protein [Domibacillus epiphyticus]OMP66657.1 hypothetical protein BTO28_11480 [Domibacillus epiphyticus]